jgi:hypothetical protein
MHEFIAKVAPQWDRAAIDAAIRARPGEIE